MGDNWTNANAKRYHGRLTDRIAARRIKLGEIPNERKEKEVDLLSKFGAVCKTLATTDGDKKLEESVKALNDAADKCGMLGAAIKLYLSTHENLLRQKFGLPPVTTPHTSASTGRYPTRSATRAASGLDNWLNSNGETPSRKRKADDDDILILDTPPPTDERPDPIMDDAFPEPLQDPEPQQGASNSDVGAPAEESQQERSSSNNSPLQDSAIADMDATGTTVATEADDNAGNAPEKTQNTTADINISKATLILQKKDNAMQARAAVENAREEMCASLNIKKEPGEVVARFPKNSSVTVEKAQTGADKDDVIMLSSDDEGDEELQRAIAESTKKAQTALVAEAQGTSGAQHASAAGVAAVAAAVADSAPSGPSALLKARRYIAKSARDAEAQGTGSAQPSSAAPVAAAVAADDGRGTARHEPSELLRRNYLAKKLFQTGPAAEAQGTGSSQESTITPVAPAAAAAVAESAPSGPSALLKARRYIAKSARAAEAQDDVEVMELDDDTSSSIPLQKAGDTMSTGEIQKATLKVKKEAINKEDVKTPVSGQPSTGANGTNGSNGANGPVVKEKPKPAANNNEIVLLSDDEDQPCTSASLTRAAPPREDQDDIEVMDDAPPSAAPAQAQGDGAPNADGADDTFTTPDGTEPLPKKRKARSSALDLDIAMNGARLEEEETGDGSNQRRTRHSKFASPEKKKEGKAEERRMDETPRRSKPKKQSQKAFFDEMVREVEEAGGTFETVDNGRPRLGPMEMFLRQEKAREERIEQRDKEIQEAIKKSQEQLSHVSELIPIYQGRGFTWNDEEDGGRWSCGAKDCNKIFHTHSQVYTHMLNDHMEGPVRGTCMKCGVFGFFPHLIVHRKTGDKNTCGGHQAALAYWTTEPKRSEEVEAAIEDNEKEMDMISKLVAHLRRCMYRGCEDKISNKPFEFEKLREHYEKEHNMMLYYTCSREDCGRVFTGPAAFVRHRLIECPNVIPIIKQRFIDKKKARRARIHRKNCQKARILAEVKEVKEEPIDEDENVPDQPGPSKEPDDVITLD